MKYTNIGIRSFISYILHTQSFQTDEEQLNDDYLNIKITKTRDDMIFYFMQSKHFISILLECTSVCVCVCVCLSNR